MQKNEKEVHDIWYSAHGYYGEIDLIIMQHYT